MEAMIGAAIALCVAAAWVLVTSRRAAAARTQMLSLESRANELSATVGELGDRNGALEKRIAELEAELESARGPNREPAAPAPEKPEPAKAEPAKAEPAKAEPAKAAPAKAEPAKAAPKEDPRERIRKQAAAMIREAHQMARFLDFDAQVERNVYRLTLDIRPAVRAEAARFLAEEPFACIKKLDIQGEQALLHIDVAVPPP